MQKKTPPDQKKNKSVSPKYPWRNVEFRNGKKSGCTVRAEFQFPVTRKILTKVPNKAGGPDLSVYRLEREPIWEPITIGMSKIGWQAWSELPEPERNKILGALAEYPIKNNLVSPPKKPKGRSKIYQRCLYTAHCLGPHFLKWAKGTKEKNPLKEKLKEMMRREGYASGWQAYSSYDFAAFLLERNWELGAKMAWPERLTRPWDAPKNFFMTTLKSPPFKSTCLSLPLPDVIKALLDGTEGFIFEPHHPLWGPSVSI